MHEELMTHAEGLDLQAGASNSREQLMNMIKVRDTTEAPFVCHCLAAGHGHTRVVIVLAGVGRYCCQVDLRAWSALIFFEPITTITFKTVALSNGNEQC